MELYRVIYHREVENVDGTILKYKNYGSYLQYSNFDNKLFESLDWKELLRELNYIEEFEGKTDRKNRVWVYVEYTDKRDFVCEKKLYKEDFVRVRSWLEKQEVNKDNVRMKELVNELSATDFINFLKDNEINYIVNI